jgi:DNA-binding NarL/FixJ family response regulator
MQSGLPQVLSDGLTVVVADDQVVTRIGVRCALEAGGLRVVAEASTSKEAFDAALVHRPDLCLLAVNIYGGGIVAAQQIRHALPHTKIVMLTDVERDDDLFEALRAGADGFLLRTTSAERLPRALRGVVEGEAALPRALTARLIAEYRARTTDGYQRISVAGVSVQLTARESQVMERLRRDEPTARIALDLGISEITVRRHISTVARKLNVSNRRAVVQRLRESDMSRAA